MPFLLFFFVFSIQHSATAFVKSSEFEKGNSPLKALVFLSSSCPCSQSHLKHLNDLAKSFPNLKLFGVATDQPHPSDKAKVEKYYREEKFEFPIVRDSDQSLVKKFGALKTPHVVLLQRSPSGEYAKIYEGGISNRRTFEKSASKYLYENLVALKEKRPLPHKQGRSLGCYIRRL